MYLGSLTATIEREQFDGVITCSNAPFPKSHIESHDKKHIQYLHLKCGAGKLGSRALRTELPRVPPFISSLAARAESPRILFACSTGKDLSVGVTLVVLCLFFDDSCKSIFHPRTGLQHVPFRQIS